MRRALKIVLWVAAGLVALILLAVIAVFVTVQTPWFHHKVRDRIVYEVERATGGRTELKSFNFDWRTLTANVTGFVIHGTEGQGEAPLFRADRITVTLKIISVLKKQVDLESAAVERPQANIIVYPDGHTNVPKPRVARKPGKGTLETVLDLAIKRFQIVDGTVQFAMRRTNLSVAGENLRAQVFYDPAPARYRGALAFRDLDVKSGQRPPLPVQVDTRFVLFRDRLEISAIHLGIRGSTVDASGALDNFRSPSLKLRYTARLNLSDVTQGVGLGPLERRGVIDLSGDVSVPGSAGYLVVGRLLGAGLSVRERGIYVENIRVDSRISIIPGRIEFRDLKAYALGGLFSGSADIVDLRDFHVQGTAQGFSLKDATRIEGVRRMEWNGTASGPVRIAGEVVRGKLAAFHLGTDVTISPAPGSNPVTGAISLVYEHQPGTLTFGPSNLQTRFSTIQFSGVLGRKMDAFVTTSNLDDAEPAIAMFTTGPPPAMPVKLQNGIARFQGSLTGPVRSPVIQGHAVMTNFITTGRQFDRAEADVVVSRTGVIAENATIARLSVRAAGALRVAFDDWRPEPREPVSGQFQVTSSNLADVLSAANEKNPFDLATGPLKAGVTLGGTVRDLTVAGSADVTRLVFYGQPIDELRGDAKYSTSALDIQGADLRIGKGSAHVAGRFEHPGGDWTTGRIRFDVGSRGIYLAQLAAVRDRVGEVSGRIETQMAGEVTLAQSGFRPGALNGWVNVRDFGASGETFGSVLVSAATKGGEVNARLEGDVLGSKIAGGATVVLSGKYPVNGRVDFTPLQFSTLLARLRKDPASGRLPFNGTVAGRVEFSGSTTDPQSWKGTLELPTVEIRPAQTALGTAVPPPALLLQNVGPVLLDLDARSARVRQAQFRARNTNLRVTGRVGFTARSPWDMRIQGNVNLALLRDFKENLYSSGNVALDISVRGALQRPDVYGRIDLKNASLNFANFPNGIDNANGVIFLYRDRMIIDRLTASSGGGNLSVGGFIALAGVTTFHLSAKAEDVRVRYPEGMSFTANAALTFTGTTDRSILGGDVTVTRIGFNPRSDLGSILSSAARPVQAPARPSPFEQGLRFDVRITTAPQVRFETQLTRDVQADASLRLRGDWTRPVLLGRVTINSGQVNFFGNQYAISSGQILFVNASKIEPTISMDLETRVQGIDVTLHVAGTMGRLNVSYRSDPPLPFSDIVALLTTGRSPTYGGLIGPQSIIGQSWQQAGASALLSQAIANPITGRLQRFFGVSRLKIDPQLTGFTTGNPAARLTVEQNIAKNLTLTYITDLSQAQAQTIRVEWDFTGNWSAVIGREENGLFGIDFFYRTQLK